MTAQRATHPRRDAILGSRWARTVSAYRITTGYLMVAVVIIVLLFTLL